MQRIVSEKMSLSDESFFDDMVSLYVAKTVVAMSRRRNPGPIIKTKDTGADEEYYEK